MTSPFCITLELERDVYNYIRLHHVDVDKVVNNYLRRKYRIYKVSPNPNIPMKDSIDLAIDKLHTDVNSIASIEQLVAVIMDLYPYAKEETILETFSKLYNKKHKYDRFL